MRMRNLIYALFTLLAVNTTCTAMAQQGSDFDRLKAEANENSLPLVNLTTDIDAVTKEEEIDGTIEIFDTKARTNGQEYFKTGCRVKYRGSSSLSYDKKSFAIKPTDESGDKTDVNIFGIREDDSWILDAMAIDRIRMRNRLCFDLWNEMSQTPYDTDYGNRNGTLGVFVELFINGNYHGLYCMTDKINRKLLGLKKADEEDDGSVTIKGVLYKGDSWSDATNLLGYDKEAPVDGETWNGWELQHPDDYPCAESWQPLMDFIDFFQASGDFIAQNYGDHLYTENLADYAILQFATNYRDCNMKNTFLSTENINKGVRFLITPWDMDTSLGGEFNGDRYDHMADVESILSSRLFDAITKANADGIMDGIKAQWKQYAAGPLSIEGVCKRIDDYAEAFTKSGAWQREHDKWNGNPVPLTEDINDELQYVKDWYARNFNHVSEALGIETGITGIDATEDGQQAKTYTLDGTRLPDGAAYDGITIRGGKKYISNADGK